MRASATSRTTPSANTYASQAKADANKADQASPFALLLEATAQSQGAKPSKRDKQDSGDKQNDKSAANQNDTSGTNQAAPQIAARPTRSDNKSGDSSGKTGKPDRRQDDSATPTNGDTTDSSQASASDPQLAGQQAIAPVPQQQIATTIPSDDGDTDDMEIAGATNIANAPAPARADGNQIADGAAQAKTDAESGASQKDAPAATDAATDARPAPTGNTPAQASSAKNDAAAAAADAQSTFPKNDAANTANADAKAAGSLPGAAAMARANAVLRSDDRQLEDGTGTQTSVSAAPKSDADTAAAKSDTATPAADPQPEDAVAQALASTAPNTDTKPAAPKASARMSDAALAQPSTGVSADDEADDSKAAAPSSGAQAENTARQAPPEGPIQAGAKPAAPNSDTAGPAAIKPAAAGKMSSSDHIKSDADRSEAPASPQPDATASSDALASKAAPLPMHAANNSATGIDASQAPQPSFTPAAITQHVQVTAQPAPNLPALAVEIAAKSQSGAKQFDIRLDPPELGRVDVRLSIDATGKASAHLSADQPHTLTLLQNDAPTLARVLREAGLDVSQDGLNFSLRQQAENFNGNTGDDGRRGGPRAFSLTATTDIDANAVTAAYQSAANGRLDIRV